MAVGAAARGPAERAALAGETNTVQADWDPAIEVPTDDWPPGSYLLRLDADTGAQRYVPVTVRSARTAGQVVIKNCVATWQAYNTWGGYDLYKGPGGSYANRSLAVSLDRPYDNGGADMFLTYERNIVKLAERMGTGVAAGAGFGHLVGIEYDRVNPAYPVPRPIEVLSHSPLLCQGVRSYGDSAYYTHQGGAGVFNAGTMRWVEAIFGDRPHGINGRTSAFVKQVTENALRAFADGPAATAYPARDNLDAMHEYAGDPIGSPGNLQ